MIGKRKQSAGRESRAWNSWCSAVLREVRFRPDHRDIREELLAHLEDGCADLERLGYDTALAEQRTLDAMGAPAEIGQALDRVHKPWLGWLWLASRWGVAVCAVLLAVCCLEGSFFGLKEALTPVRRAGDYEPEGFHYFGEGSPEREDSVRIARGHGTSTVEQAGYSISIPYAAVWKYSAVADTTGEPYDQYWYTVVVAADDRRFWDSGPVQIRSLLTAMDDAGRSYDTEWDPEGGNLIPTRVDSDLFRAVYYFYIGGAEPPGEWMELSYPYGEPWSIRVLWEEVSE